MVAAIKIQKKEKKKSTPLGVNWMRSQVLHRAAQTCTYTALHALYSDSSDTLVTDAETRSLV